MAAHIGSVLMILNLKERVLFARLNAGKNEKGEERRDGMAFDLNVPIGPFSEIVLRRILEKFGT